MTRLMPGCSIRSPHVLRAGSIHGKRLQRWAALGSTLCTVEFPAVSVGLAFFLAVGSKTRSVQLGGHVRIRTQERMPYAYLPHNYNAVPCDMYIEVSGQQLPVHSLIIQIHSTVLGDMVNGLRAKGARGTPVVLNLPDQEQDVELMLKFIYGMEHHVGRFQDAVTLFHMGNKYNIATLVVLCEPMICNEVVNMHFCGLIDPRSHHVLSEMSDHDKELRDLGKWLAYAEQHHNRNLLAKCQHSLLVMLLSYCGEGGDAFGFRAMANVLNSNQVGSRTLCSVVMSLAMWSRRNLENAGELMVGDSDGVVGMLASFNGFDQMEPAGEQ